MAAGNGGKGVSLSASIRGSVRAVTFMVSIRAIVKDRKDRVTTFNENCAFGAAAVSFKFPSH